MLSGRILRRGTDIPCTIHSVASLSGSDSTFYHKDGASGQLFAFTLLPLYHDLYSHCVCLEIKTGASLSVSFSRRLGEFPLYKRRKANKFEISACCTLDSDWSKGCNCKSQVIINHCSHFHYVLISNSSFLDLLYGRLQVFLQPVMKNILFRANFMSCVYVLSWDDCINKTA